MGNALLPEALAAFPLLLLHHGQYRGPADEVLAATAPLPGATGGGGGFPSALADPVSAAEGFDRWEFWFEWNKDVLLRARDARRSAMPALAEGENARVDTEFARREIAPIVRAVADAADPHLARSALIALGKIGGEESVPAILGALKTGSPETRRIAVLALGLSGERPALVQLAQIFEDPTAHADLRAAAAVGMGLQGRREASSILRDYLEKHLNAENAGGEERDVLLGALAAVGMVRYSSFVPVLIGRYRSLIAER